MKRVLGFYILFLAFTAPSARAQSSNQLLFSDPNSITAQVVQEYLDFISPNGRGRPMPRTYGELAQEVKRLEKPYRKLGLDPREIELDLVSLAGQHKFTSAQIRNWTQTEVLELAANTKLAKDQNRQATAINAARVQSTFREQEKNLVQEHQKAKAELERARQNGIKNLTPYLETVRSLKEQVIDLRKAYEKILNPNESSEDVLRLSMYRAILEDPLELNKLETLSRNSMNRTVNAFAGGLGFMGGSLVIDLVSAVKNQDWELFQDSLHHATSVRGLISITLFGLVADLPKDVVHALMLGKVRRIKLAAPLIETHFKRHYGFYSAFSGKLGMALGSGVTHFIDKALNSKGAEKSLKSVNEALYRLTNTTELRRRHAAFEARQIELLFEDKRLQRDIKPEELKKDLKLAARVQELEFIEKELAAIRKQSDGLTWDFFMGAAQAFQAMGDMAPSEWRDQTISVTQMILTTFVSHFVDDKLVQPALQYASNQLSSAQLYRSSKQMLRLSREYAKLNAELSIRGALKAGRFRGLAPLIAVMGSSDFFKKTSIAFESFAWKVLRPASSVLSKISFISKSGILGAVVFLGTERLIMSPIFPDTWRSSTLYGNVDAELGNVKHTLRCMLYDKRIGDCDFSHPDIKTSTKDEQMDDTGLPNDPVKYCSQVQPYDHKSLDTTGLSSGDCIRKIELMRRIQNYHLEWEDYRQKVILRSMNEKTQRWKEKIQQVDVEKVTAGHFYDWFASCEAYVPQAFLLPSKQTNLDQAARRILQSCQHLAQFTFNLSETTNEPWHEETRYERALLAEIEKHLVNYLDVVKPFLKSEIKKQADLAYQKLYGSASKSDMMSTTAEAFSVIAAKVLKPRGVDVSKVPPAQAEKLVYELIGYDNKGKTFLEMDTGELQTIGRLLTITDAKLNVTIEDFKKKLQSYSEAAKQMYLAQMYEASSPLLGPLYFDALKPEEPWYYQWYGDVLKYATGAPFNLQDSLKAEYQHFNNGLREVYTEFWKNNAKLGPQTNFVELQLSQNKASYKTINSSVVACSPSLLDGKTMATLGQAESVGQLLLRTSAEDYYKDLQSDWIRKFWNIQPQSDLLNLVIWRFPSPQADFGSGMSAKPVKFVENALSLVNAMATPAVAGFPVPNAYPWQMKRLDLVSGEVSWLLLTLTKSVNDLAIQATEIMKFGQITRQITPPECSALVSMSSKDYEVLSGDSEKDAEKKKTFQASYEACYKKMTTKEYSLAAAVPTASHSNSKIAPGVPAKKKQSGVDFY